MSHPSRGADHQHGDAGEQLPAQSASSTGHEHGSADGIEWEDDMVEINKLTTTANMHWRFVDRTTGAATTRSTGGSRSETG